MFFLAVLIHTYTHTHTHTQTRTHMHSKICTHSQAQTHKQMNTHTQTQAHTHTHTHTQTQTHTHTHTHTHTLTQHTHTHTHAHALVFITKCIVALYGEQVSILNSIKETYPKTRKSKSARNAFMESMKTIVSTGKSFYAVWPLAEMWLKIEIIAKLKGDSIFGAILRFFEEIAGIFGKKRQIFGPNFRRARISVKHTATWIKIKMKYFI